MDPEKSMGLTLVIDPAGDNTEVAGLNSLGEIGRESAEIETTHFGSPDGYREFVPSLKDGGTIDFGGYAVDEESFQLLDELSDSQEKKSFQVTWPSGATWTVTAYISAFHEAGQEIESVRGFTGTLRVSGKPVYVGAEVSA